MPRDNAGPASGAIPLNDSNVADLEYRPSKPLAEKTQPDTSAYTLGNWFRARIGRCTPEEFRAFNIAADYVQAEYNCKRCETWRDWNLRYSPLVRFLREQVADVGGLLDEKNIFCKNCPDQKRGGADAKYGMLICANHETSRKRVEETMAHELVHAYDHLRWNYDGTNLKHVACTEIRASMLSGECRFVREFFGRGNRKLVGHFQDCVRERATLSMELRPGVTSKEHAKRVVDSVWRSCFNDKRPFDDIYR